MDDGEFRTKAEEKAHLTKIIQEWNASRLDMFALTPPDKDLEFHGVVRFYFQDDRNKVVTKCIRVSSKTTVAMLMDTLVEKFNPDMKMLTHSNYELFECHEKGDTRKLGKSERPLLVQLSWHRDDREGRFLLKSASAKFTNKFFDLGKNETQFKRRLSRREKKELKKQRKQAALKEVNTKQDGDTVIAQQLYDEKPESSLTRSISNPEAVMKRRREQKIQQRLAKYQTGDGQQRGGTLKIFAESLKPEIPYKTILASINQTSDTIVKDALEKFQLENEDPSEYCLVMTKIPPGENPGPGRESVVKDQDCPLAIQSSWPASRGFLTFHLRKRITVPGHKKNMQKQKSAAELQADKRAAERLAHQSEKDQEAEEKPEDLPFFIEVLPEEAHNNYDARIFHIKQNRTIIGSSPTPLSDQYITLFAPDILAEHCYLESVDGEVTITPANADAEVVVDDIPIYETVLLDHGSFVIIANSYMFQFNNPKGGKQHSIAIASNNASTLSPGKSQNESFGQLRSPVRDGFSPISKEQVLDLPESRVDDLTVVTTFDVNGEVASSPERKTNPKGQFVSSPNAAQLSSGNFSYENVPFQQEGEYPNDISLLPATLQFVDDAQDAFFAAIISEVNGAAVHFKLAPAYSLYLACHYLISPDFRPELGQTEHGHVVSGTTRKMSVAIEKTVQENDTLAGSLAFWMANASELLHFLKQDTSLSLFTESAQGILAKSVQHAFRLLVLAMEEELGLAMPAFLDPSENSDIPESDLEHILDDDLLERAESSDLLNWTIDERTFAVHDGRAVSGDQWVTPAARIRHHGRPVMADVLYILSSAMSLLRRCRVNAALTIQLFSQLFHYLNMWLFNKLVMEPQLGLCTKAWGRRLRRRLGYVEAWAEKQGLELAADCHLCRIVQAAHLLDAPKVSAEDIASISSECFKLNSLQLKALLKMYRPDRGEHIIPQELIDNVVAVAEHTADELIKTDGREVRLDEDEQLQLPFLLPEDGYSCDIIRGVPQGLQEFLQLLIETGICRFRVNPSTSGLWTVHQEYFDENEDADDFQQTQGYFQYQNNYGDQVEEEKPAPEVISVTLQKGNKGLGLSIVAAKGADSEQLGIYIKGVVEGGTACQNGMLEPYDQIVSVNGKSLVGVTQEIAAKYMGQSGSTVILEVCKQAAVHHGLATLLSQPSPAMSPAPSKAQQGLYDKIQEPTINENSPQIRTQRWIENHGNVSDEEREVETTDRRRREEEEMYQEEENRRIKQQEEEKRRQEEERQREEEERLGKAEEQRRKEEERIREEEEARRQEELNRQIEEEKRRQEEEMRRVEEDKKRMEEARKEREVQIRQQQEEDKKRFLEEQRSKQRKRVEAERREREEREKRQIEEEERRKQEEQSRFEEEQYAEQRKRLEEDRKRAEERRKFEQRQKEYERRLRIMEEQQKKREREEAKVEEERRQEEELRKQTEAREEQERLEEAKRLKEEMRRQEERRKEEERRQQEEEQRLVKEGRKRQMEQRMRLEEDLQRQEDERLRKQEGENRLGSSMVSPINYQSSYDEDLDDLPPPPEDLLLEENGSNQRYQEEPLETRIHNQLLAEREEHNEILREQKRLQQTRVENYETNIDDYVAERRQIEQRSQQPKSTGLSHSFYSSDEDPYDIEMEFQRRLQLENARLTREKKLTKYEEDEIEFQRFKNEREIRNEHGRKLQLMIDDHDRRSNNRNKASVSDSNDSQKRMERESAVAQNQRKPSTEDDWFAMQRKNHMDSRKDQERLRQEQTDYEEQERQRKLKDVRYQREQEQKMMDEYHRQKELREAKDRKQQQQQQQQGLSYSSYDRRGNKEGIVRDEFKEKAYADYERRRETLDREIEKAEREKQIRSMNMPAPEIAKKPTQRNMVDDDEPPPPRPPPPSSLSPVNAGRSPSSTSPQPARGDRFSFSQKTVANVNSYSNTRQSVTSPSTRLYSPSSQYQQPRSGSSSRSPSREDPAHLDFRQKMKMFGASQKAATSSDARSTFSKKQREYMD